MLLGPLRAAEFTAWPVGHHRTGPFLAELLDQVDQDQLVVTATAANSTLYTAIYAGHGFTITEPGSRPKIRRDPNPIAARIDSGRSASCNSASSGGAAPTTLCISDVWSSGSRATC